jgi:hypothetical protein
MYLVLSMICLMQLESSCEYLSAASCIDHLFIVLKNPFKSNSIITSPSFRLDSFFITSYIADHVPRLGLNACCIVGLFASLSVTHISVIILDITLLPTVGAPIGLHLPFGLSR